MILEYKSPAIKGVGHFFSFHLIFIYVLNMPYFEFVYILMKLKFSLASMLDKWCPLILVDTVPIESQNVSGNPEN